MVARRGKRRWLRWLTWIAFACVVAAVVGWLWIAPVWAERWLIRALADAGLTVRALSIDTPWPSRLVARDLAVVPSSRPNGASRLAIECIELIPQRAGGRWSLRGLTIHRPRLTIEPDAPNHGWPLPQSDPRSPPDPMRSPVAWLELLDRIGLDRVDLTQGSVTTVDAGGRRTWSVQLNARATPGATVRPRTLDLDLRSGPDRIRFEAAVATADDDPDADEAIRSLAAQLALTWRHSDKTPLACRAQLGIDRADQWPADFRLFVPANDWRLPLGNGDLVGTGTSIQASWLGNRTANLIADGRLQFLAAGHAADGLRADFRLAHRAEREATHWVMTSELFGDRVESPSLGTIEELTVQLDSEIRSLTDSSIRGTAQFARASPPTGELRALAANTAFHVAGDGRVAIDRFRFRAGAGGVFTLRDATFDRTEPGIDLAIDVERLPLGTWFDLLGKSGVAGTGLLEGTLRLRVEWTPRLAIRLDRSHLVATGGGSLRIDDNEEVRRILSEQLGAAEAGGAKYDQILQERILGSLRNFAFRRLTFDVLPIDGPLGLRVQLAGIGREVPQEIEFAANFRNIQDAIDFALTMKLGIDRAKSSASGAVQSEKR